MTRAQPRATWTARYTPIPRGRSPSYPHCLIRPLAPVCCLPPVWLCCVGLLGSLTHSRPSNTATGAATAGGQAGTQRIQRLRSDQIPGAQEERLAVHLVHRLRPGERALPRPRPSPAPPRPAPPNMPNMPGACRYRRNAGTPRDQGGRVLGGCVCGWAAIAPTNAGRGGAGGMP